MVPHTPFDARNADPLMRIVNLSKSYVQRRPLTRSAFTVSAFEDVNLTIHRGTTLAIVGESGAGKSTLAKCLALLEKPTAGEILLEGKNLLALGKKDPFRTHRQIQLIFQDPTSALNPRLTAEEIIAEPLAIQRIGTKDDRSARALELMEQVGLSARSADKLAMEFSGGQRQRLAIARALALEPKLLILDESLASLDLLNQQMILSLLADLRAAHSLTYVHVSHDLRLVSEFADEVAVMSQRRIVEQKPAAELFARPQHPDTRALLAAMPSLESICLGRLA
ncbi:MAG TPA: ATP-binding cassette domain-containing protein [Candidatus Acidoferrales bacterium]|jgi:ABC-type glutathione transport system ATPase component|nr:ATP-binding cassette domain-containing protein [Candidatus Acidoferrales bacterium]